MASADDDLGRRLSLNGLRGGLLDGQRYLNEPGEHCEAGVPVYPVIGAKQGLCVAHNTG